MVDIFIWRLPGYSDIEPRLRNSPSNTYALGDFLVLLKPLYRMASLLVSWLMPGWCSSGSSWVNWMVAQWGDRCPEFPVRPMLRLCLLKMLLVLTNFLLPLFLLLLRQATSLYYIFFLLTNYFKLPAQLSYWLFSFLQPQSTLIEWLYFNKPLKYFLGVRRWAENILSAESKMALL